MHSKSKSDRSIFPAINSHVIHDHRLRKNGCRIRVSRPVAANGEIQNEMKPLIEWRRKASRPRVPVGLRLVKVIVHIPPHHAWCPVETEDVKVIGESACREREVGTFVEVP